MQLTLGTRVKIQNNHSQKFLTPVSVQREERRRRLPERLSRRDETSGCYLEERPKRVEIHVNPIDEGHRVVEKQRADTGARNFARR